MRKRMSLLLACTLLLPLTAPCQKIQRLIIPSADVSIGPDGSAVIKTYCTDYGIMGPKQGQEYRHLLTSGDSTTVTVGGREMTLEDAISTHKIKLVTPRPTIDSIMADERMFKTLNPDLPMEDYGALLRLLPLDKRNKLLAEFQNESSLKIVNLSGEKVNFHARNAALGVSDGPPPTMAENTQSQTSFWISQVQHRLVGQGYDVPTNGVVDAKTQAALKAFQIKYGFKATGTATQEVAQKLAQLEDVSQLRALSTNDFIILRLENHPTANKRLEATGLDGSTIYNGNEIHSLVNKIISTANGSGKTVYVDPINFSASQVADLSNSLRMADTDVPVGVFPKPEASTLVRDVFLAKGVKLDGIEVKSVEVLEGPKKGWFHSIINFFVNFHGRVRKVTAEVWTRTSLQMSQFLQSVGNGSSDDFDATQSIAMIVASGRKNIVSSGGKADDMDVQIVSATHRFWAHLEKEIPPTLKPPKYDEAG
jgi:peptidoglycan hydrolase-like protein with peptidoglycan-binding domain